MHFLILAAALLSAETVYRGQAVTLGSRLEDAGASASEARGAFAWIVEHPGLDWYRLGVYSDSLSWDDRDRLALVYRDTTLLAFDQFAVTPGLDPERVPLGAGRRLELSRVWGARHHGPCYLVFAGFPRLPGKPDGRVGLVVKRRPSPAPGQ